MRDRILCRNPSFLVALVPLCLLSLALFLRHPLRTGFVQDEQEALLANPYVRSIELPASKVGWLDAFHRDFWGRRPEATVGSYRPLPNLVWRALWGLGARQRSPFFHHLVNVLVHGGNGALMVLLVLRWTRRRAAAWSAGVAFVACAALTESVCCAVGLADVLAATAALLALRALSLPAGAMPPAVFAATLLGLGCKESALCLVPLVPFAAHLFARQPHPTRPRSWLRAALAAAATSAAFLLYVEARRRMFPVENPSLLPTLATAKPLHSRILAALVHWYAQPPLPLDPIRNPLIDRPTAYRVAGALRVYFHGLVQLVFPLGLSGDYSAQQEPAPATLLFPESVLGALAATMPLAVSLLLVLRSLRRRATSAIGERAVDSARMDKTDAAWAFALAWPVVSYLPVSNVFILLPTVRADRFWYLPAVGFAMLAGMLIARLQDWSRFRLGRVRGVQLALISFFVLHAVCARLHAKDYADDLTFWEATRRASPRSAMAHLNYAAMLGIAGRHDERLRESETALLLAPAWPTAHVYMGDALCGLHRVADAWPYYVRGFDSAPDDADLVALGLQCLWEEGALGRGSARRDQLAALGAKYPGSWLDVLTHDVLEHGDAQGGVAAAYRSREYDDGPAPEWRAAPPEAPLGTLVR